jgi:hypothetical protein
MLKGRGLRPAPSYNSRLIRRGSPTRPKRSTVCLHVLESTLHRATLRQNFLGSGGSCSSVSESSAWGGWNRTMRVFSGWTVSPYWLIRLGRASMIRRASSSRAAPITKLRPLFVPNSQGLGCGSSWSFWPGSPAGIYNGDGTSSRKTQLIIRHVLRPRRDQARAWVQVSQLPGTAPASD